MGEQMTGKVINVTVNAQPMTFDEGSTIESVISLLGLEKSNIVAELDGKIIKRVDFARHELKRKSVLELVRFVGGG